MRRFVMANDVRGFRLCEAVEAGVVDALVELTIGSKAPLRVPTV
jgi:hypothetical protein